MRIGQPQVSQIQASELLGSSPGKAPQGFSELLMGALLGGKGLSQEPCFPLSGAVFPGELESGQREPHQGVKTDSNALQLLGWLSFSASCVSSQAPLFSELKETGDPVKSTQEDYLTNSFEFPQRPQGSGPESLEVTVCQEYLFMQPKQAAGQSEKEILGILKNQAKNSISSGFSLADPSKESSGRESAASQISEKALKEAALALKGAQGADLVKQEVESGLTWGISTQGVQDKPFEKSLTGSDEPPCIQPGSSSRACDFGGHAPKPPLHSGVFQLQPGPDLNRETSVFPSIERSLLGYYEKSPDYPLIVNNIGQKAFQPKEEESVKLFVDSGKSPSSPFSGSGPQEQQAGSVGQSPEGSDMASPKFHLSREGLEQPSSPEELHPRGGSSHGLQGSDPGALAQKPLGQAALNQIAPEAQFSGNSQGIPPEAPKTKLFGEVTTTGFATEPKAQVQAEQFKDRQVVHMQMEPPDLGLLRVRLKVHKEGVEALFLTQGPEQKAVLEQGLSQLRQSLAEQGFLSQRLAVDVGGGGAQWMSQGKADPSSAWGPRSVKSQEESEKNQESLLLQKEQGILHLRI